MKISTFYDNIRPAYCNIYEEDNMLISILANRCDRKFILNNRLSCYVTYLWEKGLIEINHDFQSMIYSVYNRFKKLNNTIEYLERIGNETNTKFLLIKTVNVVPYMPVYDVDLVADNDQFFKSFEILDRIYKPSDYKEENKISYINRDSDYFKLAFHQDITWDGIKKMNIDSKELWKDNIKLSSCVYVNSPKIEALIRIQECLLERLHINLIDYIFINCYMDKKYDYLLQKKIPLTSFPQFIDISDIWKLENGIKLSLKNALRLITWKTYSSVTRKVPFHEF